MNAASGAAVVVGVDGSEPAQRAVRLAAGEAARRGRTLRVVHGFVWPLLRVPLGPVPDAPPGAGLREQAERLVARAVAHAEAAAPGCGSPERSSTGRHPPCWSASRPPPR